MHRQVEVFSESSLVNLHFTKVNAEHAVGDLCKKVTVVAHQNHRSLKIYERMGQNLA